LASTLDVASPPPLPHTCTVAMIKPLSYQASSNQLILFRLGWGTQTQTQCQAFASHATVTFTFQGLQSAYDTLPCAQRPDGTWATDFRLLSQPLPPGSYVASARMLIDSEISDGYSTIPAGTVDNFSVTVVVVSQG
jgi:hypothetical protein